MGLFGKKQVPPPPVSQTAMASNTSGGGESAPDMFETIFNMKYTAKQLGKLSQKSEKSVAVEKRKCKEAIEKGNVEGAKIHAENAIRNEKQALSYLKLQSRVDAVTSKLEGHSKMMQVTSGMQSVSESLSSALGQMDITKISNVMDTFEKQFEDLDLQAAYLDTAISDSTAVTTPQSEVNQLLQQVADEHNLKVTADFMGTTVPGTKASASGVGTGAAAQQDDLEARFNNLQQNF